MTKRFGAALLLTTVLGFTALPAMAWRINNAPSADLSPSPVTMVNPNGPLTVTNVTANGNITATGALAVSGNTTLGANLALTGNETVGGTLGVTGASTLTSLGVTGAETVGGTLTANGNVNAAGNGNFLGINLTGGPNGEIRFQGTHVYESDSASTYQRPVTSNGTWYVFSGTPDTQRFSIDRLGNGVFSGPFSLSSTLAVSGTTTLANTTLGANSTLSWSGRSQLSSVADGISLWSNNAGNGFTGLKFGAATSSFPYLKVSGASFAVRLADDSADANISAANGTFSGTLGVTGAATMSSTLAVTSTLTANSNVRISAGNTQSPNGTLAAPAYSYAGSPNSGWYLDPNGPAVAANGVQAGYFQSSGVGSLVLPRTTTTFSTDVAGVRLGPANSTGVVIFRNGTGILSFGLADGSGNATTAAYRFTGTNLDGTTQFGSAFGSDVSGLKLYFDTSASAANNYAIVLQQRINTVQKTTTGSNITVAKADTGKRLTNKGATGQTVFALPAATGVGTFTTSAEVMYFIFTNLTSFGLKIQAAGSDVIQFPGSASTGGGGQSTTTIGGSAHIYVCDTGTWCTVSNPGGTWAAN